MQTSTHPFSRGDVFRALESTREFDLWLQRELGRLHGNVLHEPVPEALLRILDEASAVGD